MKLDKDYEEWDQEDEKPVKPLTGALVCLGLVAAAAIICAILWNVTHSDKDSGTENPAVEQTGEEVPEEESEMFSGRDTETVPEESTDPETETIPQESPDPGTETIPEESQETGSRTDSESAESAEEEAEASDPDAAGGGSQEQDMSMAFAECQDTVTPKEVINLRSAPSTAQADNIVTQAANGELLARTGVNNDTGWSRVEYNGQTLYAVSRYLTTDLAYQPPTATADPNSVSTKDGRTITFTDCDDNISPKMYVNLRLEPSTSEGNATVHCRLDYGEVVHRTGVSEESGWSRVEYDGYVLYVVTSYMYVVEEQ